METTKRFTNRMLKAFRSLYKQKIQQPCISDPAVQQDHYDLYEFLPAYIQSMERPPSPHARVTAMVISILISLGCIWAYWGALDIHATAYGQLVLPSRSQHIQPYELSKVVKILVKEGQHVQAGDKLLVLHMIGSTQEIIRCQAQKSFHTLARARYQALLSDQPLQHLFLPKGIEKTIADRTKAHVLGIWKEHQTMLQKFDAELATNRSEQIAYQTSIKCLQKLLCNIEKRLTSSRKLTQSNMMAKMELLAKEKEALETKLSLSTKQKELKTLQIKADTLRKTKTSYIAQKKREWHDRFNEAASALLMAAQELAKAQDRGRLQTLQAPLGGLVQQVAVHTIGGIVQAAQTLMVIAPDNPPKQATIDIANQHIGFVEPGQLVAVKIESFPYSRYGTINGKIMSLSRDSVQKNGYHGQNELVFPAQIELEKDHIMVDGKPVVLTPGMKITAEIKIGKRRIIDYLLSPIRRYTSQACREP
ncbi:HlyD family type I secretion periplasmic adaptor subunit [Candidatus Cardinium hertigii]|uniref:HlyD family type I secretion periplasmic adaptor subunit n=1 Tax=Candidatus Cardinium hertigii TaxID=247481 RepID=UPI003D7D29D7